MTWCVLRNESRLLPVNVVDLHFDVDRPSSCHSHGQLTVEAGVAEIRSALEDFAHRREAIVLERNDGAAIEMRLSGGRQRTNVYGIEAATYD